jgi:hypothetical protein
LRVDLVGRWGAAQDRVQVYSVCVDDGRAAFAATRAAALATIAAAAAPPRLLLPLEGEEGREDSDEDSDGEPQHSSSSSSGAAAAARATEPHGSAHTDSRAGIAQCVAATGAATAPHADRACGGDVGAGGAERADTRVSVSVSARLVAECGTVGACSVVSLAALGRESHPAAAGESHTASVGVAAAEAAGGVTLLRLRVAGDGSLTLHVASHAPLGGAVALSVCGLGGGVCVAASLEGGDAVLLRRGLREEEAYLELQHRRRQQAFEAFGVQAN